MRSFLLLFLIIMACRPSNKIGKLVGVPKERSLENTYWVLNELNETSIVNSNSGKLFIELKAETKRIVGFGGCNQISGGYTITGSKIKFSTATTRMFCQQTMEVETSFLKALSTVTTFEIKEHDLFLKSENIIVLKFHAGSAMDN
jgi:heat shock protein HslJ